jgi:hypothetical protein
MVVTMNTEVETVYEDQRGRMKLKIIRKNGKYGPRFSALVYRPYKKEESEHGQPVWEETHWLDEQDVLNALRLHEVADDMIAEAKRQVSASKEAA